MKRVSKVLMVNKTGQVLILKRSFLCVTIKSPWIWDYPGGHLEEDETWFDGLIREVQEETGFHLNNATEIFATKWTKFYESSSWEGDEVKLSWEHEEYKWIDPKEIDNYNISDDYQRAVRHLAGISVF